MRVIVAMFTVLVFQVTLALAQSTEEVKTDILAALSTPMPITVVGPLLTRDVKVVKDGDGFRATLEDATLMGLIPMGTLSFKITPAGDKLYRVTEFQLPKKLDIFNFVSVNFGPTTFDGLWSVDTRSYQNLNFKLSNVGVVPKGAKDAKVSIGTLSLTVAKQGLAGAAESQFSLQATDIISKGLPPNNVKMANLSAELKAKGEEPVDLYAVVSRFAVLTAIQQNTSAALQFAESLRAKKYESVVLNLAMAGVESEDVTSNSGARIKIANITGAAKLTAVTPDEWGAISLKLNGDNISQTGLIDFKEMKIDKGVVSLEGATIPIAATLNAIAKLQSLSRGEPTNLRASELIDGFLNLGAFKLQSSASGISYIPFDEKAPIVKVGSYAFETGSEGLRDNKGKLFLSTSAEGLNVQLRKFDSDLEEKTLKLLNPQSFNYNLAVSDLNEPLLRKLMADVTLNSTEDYLGLAAPSVAYVMALKPTIETKDASFKSTDVEASLASNVRFYPAWLLDALPYEGTSKISIKGLDKLSSLLDDYIAQPAPPVVIDAPVDGQTDVPIVPSTDKTGYIVGQSLISTFKAMAVTEGDAQTWTISYPKAGQAMMLVNDIEMRFPNFSNYLTPLMMAGFWR